MADRSALYDPTYYVGNVERKHTSAEVVVPLLLEWLSPQSVVDVGCGTGGWLQSFICHGVTDVLGVEGPWGGPELASGQVHLTDLDRPISLEREFDLVMTLEVAEHLDPVAEQVFVDSLVALGNVVLFSAAIPGQGGTRHVNEQWPSHWGALFAARGFQVFDVLRPRIWQNNAVAPWYRQNMMLFARPDHAGRLSELAASLSFGGLDVVHPRHFETHLPSLQEFPGLLATRLRGQLRPKSRVKAALAGLRR
jgi:SAM-dependent methyltransferase